MKRIFTRSSGGKAEDGGTDGHQGAQLYINHDCFFFLLSVLSLALLSEPSSINPYLFIYFLPIPEVKSENGGVHKCKGDGGQRGHWLTRPFPLLSSGASLEDLAAWSTPPLPPPPPPPSPLKSLCCVHSCTVHITSAAPSYSPTTAPPSSPVIAQHVHPPPHPPHPREATAFSTSRARPDTQAWDTRTDWWAHACSSSPFPFSHIIQFLPLLFTLRKIPWPHDPMKA